MEIPPNETTIPTHVITLSPSPVHLNWLLQARVPLDYVAGGLLLAFLVIRVFFYVYLACKGRSSRSSAEPVWRRLLLGGSLVALVVIGVLISIWPSWFWWSFALPRKHTHIVKQWMVILQLVGIPICFLSDVLFLLVHIHLGTNWSGFVQLMDNHRLVTSGPYRFARHPMYTSLILYNIAVPLCTCNWLLTVILTVNTILAASRIKIEERLLIGEFGDEYIDFLRDRGAFWPCKLLDCGLSDEEAAESHRLGYDVGS